jgi:hypothetical protein
MMRTKLKKLLSLLLIACMLLSIPPLWAIEAHAVDHSSADSRSTDGFSVGNNGTFVIAALVDGVYYAMSNTISGKITGTAIRVTNGCVSPQDATGYTFTFTYSNGVYTIQNDTQYLKYASSTNLGSSTTAYYWTITSGDNGSWRMISETDSRGLVFRAKTYNQFGAYALSNVKVGSAEYFDMEILPVTTACSHSYQYSSNGNGTHIVKCNKCNYRGRINNY